MKEPNYSAVLAIGGKPLLLADAEHYIFELENALRCCLAVRNSLEETNKLLIARLGPVFDPKGHEEPCQHTPSPETLADKATRRKETERQIDEAWDGALDAFPLSAPQPPVCNAYNLREGGMACIQCGREWAADEEFTCGRNV